QDASLSSITPVDHHTSGPSHQWTITSLDHHTSGPSHHWTITPVDHHITGPSHQWTITPVDHHITGPSHLWTITSLSMIPFRGGQHPPAAEPRIIRPNIRQPIAQFVPLPPTPDGWNVCHGCEMVFVQDGQRFCGLCQYRTPAGSNYMRIHTAHLRRLMNLAEEMRNQLAPNAGQVNRNNPPPVFPVPAEPPNNGVPGPAAEQNLMVDEALNQEEEIFLENMLLDD
ncbi:unnamed protein product, partial [Allacma fusca]